MEHYSNTPQPTLTSHELQQVGPGRGRKHFVVNRPGSNQRDPRRNPPNGSRPPKPRAPKPASFCHDKLLKEMQGRKIRLVYHDDTTAEATLVDNDRYVLVVRHEQNGQTAYVFKSALAAFTFPALDA